MPSRKPVPVEYVSIGDTIIRYGMTFTVTGVAALPAERGGTLVELSLTRVGVGGRSTLTLNPGEHVTTIVPQ